MTIPHAQTRYHAATMELVAYLDEQRVEMHIVTETGETVAVACARDSKFSSRSSGWHGNAPRSPHGAPNRRTDRSPSAAANRPDRTIWVVPESDAARSLLIRSLPRTEFLAPAGGCGHG
jgi:hypothetical protein